MPLTLQLGAGCVTSSCRTPLSIAALGQLGGGQRMWGAPGVSPEGAVLLWAPTRRAHTRVRESGQHEPCPCDPTRERLIVFKATTLKVKACN